MGENVGSSYKSHVVESMHLEKRCSNQIFSGAEKTAMSHEKIKGIKEMEHEKKTRGKTKVADKRDIFKQEKEQWENREVNSQGHQPIRL